MSYNSKLKLWFYTGERLPRSLEPFRSKEFSRERWLEEEFNKNPRLAVLNPDLFTPKEHQAEAAKAIARAYDQGWSGFLLADKTGVGKTLSALSGVALMAKRRGFTPKNRAKLLVVCPKAVIPQWRQTFKSYKGTLLLRPLVLNYQQLQKLIKAPTAKAAKTKRGQKRQLVRDGSPLIPFDYIVFDEAHRLKNYPSSATSLAAATVASLNETYEKGKSPFVIFSTATPGASPLNFAPMAGFMGPLLGSPKPLKPSQWGDFLISKGFAVTKGKSGYSWAPLPWGTKDANSAAVRAVKKKQRADAQKLGKALLKPGAPFLMRSPKDIAGWPEQQLIPMPLELDSKQRELYQEAWSTFRAWLKLTPPKADPKGALVQQLRYRQKTSLLRVDAYEELIQGWLEEGKQVYLSCEFIETVDKLKEKLQAKGIRVAEISGRTTERRETERLLFQKGVAPVLISTVVEGISLHRGEHLADGTRATDAERVTVLADIRQNPQDSTQALGRAHRDGTNSIAYIPYIEDSVDKKVVDSFINKTINSEVMVGKSLQAAEELEQIFRKAVTAHASS